MEKDLCSACDVPPKKGRFTIPWRLPGMNEIINAARHNRYTGAHQKKKVTRQIAEIIQYSGVPYFTRPVVVRIRFIEPNRRRDRDNIQSGSKFVMDALVAVGRLKRDSQKWVKDLKADVSDVVDGSNPRVEVEIEDVA